MSERVATIRSRCRLLYPARVDVESKGAFFFGGLKHRWVMRDDTGEPFDWGKWRRDAERAKAEADALQWQYGLTQGPVPQPPPEPNIVLALERYAWLCEHYGEHPLSAATDAIIEHAHYLSDRWAADERERQAVGR